MFGMPVAHPAKQTNLDCFFNAVVHERVGSDLCNTAISFSMLFSFPSNAFLGMHLMATSRWVFFSSARNTSENAPLEKSKDGVSAAGHLTFPIGPLRFLYIDLRVQRVDITQYISQGCISQK